MKRTIILIMISFFVLSAYAPGFASDNSSESPSVPDIVGDVLWIRPWGFIATGLQAIAYVISLPVTTHLNKTKEAEEFLIQDPYNFYFKRPLGEM